jgi:hypothetical protein
MICDQIDCTVSCFIEALWILTQRAQVVTRSGGLKHGQRLVNSWSTMENDAHSTARSKPALLSGTPTMARFSRHSLSIQYLRRKF